MPAFGLFPDAGCASYSMIAKMVCGIAKPGSLAVGETATASRENSPRKAANEKQGRTILPHRTACRAALVLGDEHSKSCMLMHFAFVRSLRVIHSAT
jgi:hypothetical protein